MVSRELASTQANMTASEMRIPKMEQRPARGSSSHGKVSPLIKPGDTTGSPKKAGVPKRLPEWVVKTMGLQSTGKQEKAQGEKCSGMVPPGKSVPKSGGLSVVGEGDWVLRLPYSYEATQSCSRDQVLRLPVSGGQVLRLPGPGDAVSSEGLPFSGGVMEDESQGIKASGNITRSAEMGNNQGQSNHMFSGSDQRVQVARQQQVKGVANSYTLLMSPTTGTMKTTHGGRMFGRSYSDSSRLDTLYYRGVGGNNSLRATPERRGLSKPLRQHASKRENCARIAWVGPRDVGLCDVVNKGLGRIAARLGRWVQTNSLTIFIG